MRGGVVRVDNAVPRRRGRRCRRSRRRVRADERALAVTTEDDPQYARGARLLGARRADARAARPRRGAATTAAGGGDPRRQRRQGRGGAVRARSSADSSMAMARREDALRSSRRLRSCSPASRRPRPSSRSCTPGWPRTRCSPATLAPRPSRRVGARDRGRDRARRDHGATHPRGFADRARRPRRDRRPAGGARSRAGARLGLGDRDFVQVPRRSRVAGRRAGAGPAAAGRRERAGRPPWRLQPGVVEQGRRAGAAVRARPVGRGAHPCPAADATTSAWTSRWWWRSTSGLPSSICGGGSRSATSRRSSREPARWRSSRCSRRRSRWPPRRRCDAGDTRTRRGTRGRVRDRHPRQGRDVPVGVRGGGRPPSRSRWACPRSPTTSWRGRNR